MYCDICITSIIELTYLKTSKYNRFEYITFMIKHLSELMLQNLFEKITLITL